jgi:hypothetical protein
MKPVLIALLPAMLLGACAAGPQSGLSATNTVEHERRACANMGIAPGSGQFSRCVSNLDQTLTDDSRVGQG